MASWDYYGKIFNNLDQKYNNGIESFYDYLDFVDNEISDVIQKFEIKGIKIQPYNRSLFFEYVDEKEARDIFEKDILDINKSESKKFQDFIMHRVIQRIIDEKLVIQIHTGAQGMLIDIDWGNPLKLNNILILYPEGKFDLFHAGYPFSDVLIAMCKTSRNAYFNLCWIPILVESGAEEILKKVLDALPNNKIMWGGDCGNVEEIYGALCFGKEVIIKVLAEEVIKQKISLDNAKFISENIFRNNAKRLYNL